MKKFTLILVRILLSFSLLLSAALSPAQAFSDVSADSPYAQDIQELEKLGILQGEKLEPEKNLSREMLAKWMLKNAGFQGEQYKPKTKKRFADVEKKENPYAPYIYRLTDLGIAEGKVRGGKSYFSPKKPLTRIETIQWILEIQGVPVPKIFDENSFQATDVPTDSEIAPLIHKAIELGMLAPGKIKPYAKIKRAEAAHLLHVARTAGPSLTVTIMPTMESDLARNPKYDIMVGAWNKILASYLRRDKISREKLLYGAIEGMVKELDDKHSDFERPGDNALLDSLSGEIEGIGAVVQMKDDEVVIVSPIAGSPAEKAGLLPNDIIQEVNDVSTKGQKLSEVVKRIRGKKGTEVKLKIKRNGKTLTISVTRDIVKIVSVALARTEDNIAVVNLRDFSAHSDTEFGAIAAELVEKKPKGIIIDLRNNPGGFLDMAIAVGGHFIKQGDAIANLKYPDQEVLYASKGQGELAAMKTIIITNAGSASASEILAGALQDYGLAKIVGEQSFGKGTVQELSDFTDGSTLKLTVAEWLTAKSRSIEKNGITPDIEVKLTDEDRKAGKDPQMERALAELR